MRFFLLWWCFDDHLAAAVNVAELGTLPWWVVLLFSLAVGSTHVTTNSN